MIRFRFLGLGGLCVLGLGLLAAPLDAEEPAAAAPAAAAEKPEPLPARGPEANRPSRFAPVVKHGHARRVGRSQSNPTVLSPEKLLTFPYNLVGFISFLEGGSAYQGSGTVVKPRSVVTAAHILWTPGIGWSTNVKFFRARYGSNYQNLAKPNRLFIHGNYMPAADDFGDTSAYTFGWDIGWMTFPYDVAGGGYAGVARRYGALTGTNYCVAVGYGEGTFPKYCEPSEGYYRFDVSAYFLNDSYDHQGGMSGGPIFSRIQSQLFETAVVVSSGGGVRAIDGYMLRRIAKLP